MKKAKYFNGVSTHSPNALFTHSARSFSAPGQLESLPLEPLCIVLLVRLCQPETSSSSSMRAIDW